MSYDAELIANYLIRKAEAAERPITAMQLQKLLYFAHGWNLAFTGEPLLRQRVEAWQYGPVVSDVYHALKHLGADDLRGSRAARRERHWKEGEGWSDDYEVGDAEAGDALSQETEALLDQVYDTYGGLSGPQLSGMTHVDGGPWKRAYEKGSRSGWINDNEIESYFKARLAENKAY